MIHFLMPPLIIFHHSFIKVSFFFTKFQQLKPLIVIFYSIPPITLQNDTHKLIKNNAINAFSGVLINVPIINHKMKPKIPNNYKYDFLL